AMLGSPLYMSPEQLRSSKTVDQRTDIWAFGVILYELMTGTHPFMGETLGELFAAILETEPEPLWKRASGVRPGLDQIVLRCLRRVPDQRFERAVDLAQVLTPYADPSSSVGTLASAAAPASAHSLPFGGAVATPPGGGPGGGMGATPHGGGVAMG